MPLAGKVAIVTGAGRGLGAAIARDLAAAGASVVVNDLNPDRAQTVAGTIQERGDQAIAVAADIANKFQCVHLVEAARDHWNRLDILVNAARVRPSASVLKMDEWDWNRCLDVNVKGTFFMCQLCGRVMADENKERGGVIVNVGHYADMPSPPTSHAVFWASKMAVSGFSRVCAREFDAFGVRVYAVLPPFSINTAPDRSRHRATVAVVRRLCAGVDTPSDPIVPVAAATF